MQAMTLTDDKHLSNSIGKRRRLNWLSSFSLPYPRLPPLSRAARIKLLIASLAINFAFGIDLWWYMIEQPNEDAAQLIDVASGLANLDRDAAGGGFVAIRQPAMTERRSVLLAEAEPVLHRLGAQANPELLGVIVNGYQQQGDYAHAIEFGKALADAPTTPLSLRVNAYKALGHLYLDEIGGSPADASKSFATALDLIQGNDDPQSRAVVAGIDAEWANVLVQLGQVNDAFHRLLQGRQQAINLACGFAGRNRLLAVLTDGLNTLAAQDDGRANHLRTSIADHPDPCLGNQ